MKNKNLLFSVKAFFHKHLRYLQDTRIEIYKLRWLIRSMDRRKREHSAITTHAKTRRNVTHFRKLVFLFRRALFDFLFSGFFFTALFAVGYPPFHIDSLHLTLEIKRYWNKLAANGSRFLCVSMLDWRQIHMPGLYLSGWIQIYCLTRLIRRIPKFIVSRYGALNGIPKGIEE